VEPFEYRETRETDRWIGRGLVVSSVLALLILFYHGARYFIQSTSARAADKTVTLDLPIETPPLRLDLSAKNQILRCAKLLGIESDHSQATDFATMDEYLQKNIPIDSERLPSRKLIARAIQIIDKEGRRLRLSLVFPRQSTIGPSMRAPASIGARLYGMEEGIGPVEITMPQSLTAAASPEHMAEQFKEQGQLIADETSETFDWGANSLQIQRQSGRISGFRLRSLKYELACAKLENAETAVMCRCIESK
jgi:hypothetical protein